MDSSLFSSGGIDTHTHACTHTHTRARTRMHSHTHTHTHALTHAHTHTSCQVTPPSLDMYKSGLSASLLPAVPAHKTQYHNMKGESKQHNAQYGRGLLVYDRQGALPDMGLSHSTSPAHLPMPHPPTMSNNDAGDAVPRGNSKT